MPRLIRRQPLKERIKAYLNPLDFLLWLSEHIESNDWDQFEKDWAVTLGFAVNVVFLIARANSRPNGSKAVDDVFGDDGGVPWLSWLASFVVHVLSLVSVLNTFYTFYRKRHYRMFEASVDETPVTPSAQRVRVDSSPMSSSPLQYLANVISGSAESRAHPDAQRDVWELAIWDPLPICVRIFSFFSPAHVLVYMVSLPTQLSDPRPSVTIVTTMVITALLSAQMSLLCSSFTRQAKDSTLVHKEVLKEYDTKYVLPRTQPLMRDVGTQFSEGNAATPGSRSKYNKVDTFTPTHLLKRGFKTSPNPNYVGYVDPEGQTSRRQSSAPPTDFPNQHFPMQTPSNLRDSSPAFRTPRTSIRQPQFRPTPSTAGDGGSLGVFSHANSPLRKSVSTNFDRRLQNNGDFYYKERGTSPLKRQSSPLKKSNAPGSMEPPVSAPRRNFSNIGNREMGRMQ